MFICLLSPFSVHLFVVWCYANGQQALDQLRSGQFQCDLILSDVLMPVMNGYDLLRNIRSDPKLRHLTVVMMSGLDSRDEVCLCFHTYVRSFILIIFCFLNLLGSFSIAFQLPLCYYLNPTAYPSRTI